MPIWFEKSPPEPSGFLDYIENMIGIKYNEFQAVFSIPDGELLDGKIPQNKTKLVKAWIEIRQEDLMADWSLAIKGEPIFKIEPLR